MKVDERDRNFISGNFLDDNLPQDKVWLSKYFKSEFQRRFLIYILTFNGYHYFRRHTGIKCSVRYLKMLKKKYKKLEDAHKKAKEDFDLDTLAKIEMGKYKISNQF